MTNLFYDRTTMDFNDIAIKRYPNEAGAVFINNECYEVTNVSPTPTKAMQFSGEELLKLEMQHGPIEKYIHSHPFDSSKIPTDYRYQPEWASTQDMSMWIALNKPFGIVATDGVGCNPVLWYDDANRAPLLGRQFIHGLHDCYSVIRDQFHVRGIDLPNFPRGWDWWNHGENLYIDNFTKAGFVEIPREDATVNDCIIYKIGARSPNHAAVIVGPNGILHHLIDRQSRVDQRSKWARCEVMAVRYCA